MIVVSTADFELYHGVVTELRERGADFTTVEPGDDLPAGASVLIAAPGDDPEAPVPCVVADPDDPRSGVDEALARQRDAPGRTVIGIDPGTKPGVAVLEGDDVVAAFQVPAADAADVVRREVEGAADPVVRVGDGARIHGSRLVDDLDDVRVELVDETATTPHLGAGARGMGDVLAAVNIARREGDPVDTRAVEPTPGELEVIKRASRERSAGNRAIDEALARRVAKGDLTIEDALAEHREK